MPNLGLDNLTHRLRRRYAGRGLAPEVNAAIQRVIGETRQEKEHLERSPCLVDGCPRDAISSHVIPDFLLRTSGGTGALVTPVVTEGTAVAMEPVDARYEPRFPGYCHHHDVDLFPWERTRLFGGASGAAGQLMRVTDATIHEVSVRAQVLTALGARLHPASEQLQGVHPFIGPDHERVLRADAGSLARSGAEAGPLLADLRLLRTGLLSAAVASPTPGRPHIAYLHVPGGAGPHFADALWMPRGEVLDLGSRTPLAMCALSDAAGYHLLLATLGQDWQDLDRLEQQLRSAPAGVYRFAAHCMVWATHYSFMDRTTWEHLDEAAQVHMLADLRLTYFTQAAIHAGDPVRIPFIRAGNGWL